VKKDIHMRIAVTKTKHTRSKVTPLAHKASYDSVETFESQFGPVKEMKQMQCVRTVYPCIKKNRGHFMDELIMSSMSPD
jgi:hypothetical protein